MPLEPNRQYIKMRSIYAVSKMFEIETGKAFHISPSAFENWSDYLPRNLWSKVTIVVENHEEAKDPHFIIEWGGHRIFVRKKFVQAIYNVTEEEYE